MAEDVVRARRFELVDDQDTPRAALYMEAGQPILTLADKEGSARVQVAVNQEDNATLRFRDAAGHERVQLAAWETGTAFLLTDPTGTVSLSLAIGEDGHVFVSAEENGQRRAMAALVPGGPIVLNLWDAEGNQTLGLRQGE